VIRLSYTIALGYEVAAPGADFLFNLLPAQTDRQRVVSEYLHLDPTPTNMAPYTDPRTRTRWLRVRAEAGRLQVHARATVELKHHFERPSVLREVRIAALPEHVLPYLRPSRYCEADRVQMLANEQFGKLPPGYARAMAVRDWVEKHVTFRSGTSNSSTSACDTLSSRHGVCRDFAHVMISLCRALGMPARFTTGFDYGADPALGPPDFHAYVEVWLGDRWYLFDPSGAAIPMALVRLATGRDAADAAFASIFGAVRWGVPLIHIEAVADDSGRLVTPVHTDLAVSTDDGRDAP